MNYYVLVAAILGFVLGNNFPKRRSPNATSDVRYGSILETLLIIQKNQQTMKEVLDQLLAKVNAQTTVVASNNALLTKIKDLLDKAVANNPGGDPALVQEVTQISNMIGDNTQAISDAILKNTPAEPKTVSLTATSGETIVVTLKDGETIPTVGDSATVNGQPFTTGASYTFSDGSSLTLDTSSNVSAYSAATETQDNGNTGNGVTV